MRWAAGILAFVVLGAFTASAASLEVDAGVLRMWDFADIDLCADPLRADACESDEPDDPDEPDEPEAPDEPDETEDPDQPPVVPTVDLTIEARYVTGDAGNKPPIGTERFGTYPIPSGADYTVEWSAAFRRCWNGDQPQGQEGASGSVADEDLTHVICVQERGPNDLPTVKVDGRVIESAATVERRTTEPAADSPAIRSIEPEHPAEESSSDRRHEPGSELEAFDPPVADDPLGSDTPAERDVVPDTEVSAEVETTDGDR